MLFRRLASGDYAAYQKLIHSNISKQVFDDFLALNYLTAYVITLDGQLVATGTLLIEQKLTNGGCVMGHIENVYVNSQHRHKGYGKFLTNCILEQAKLEKCYRVDLVCKPELKEFYAQFDAINLGMAYYIKENFKQRELV